MAIQLFNTLTRKKEDFVPLEPGKVKFYMCGPTVYDYIHIGNARAFVVFDVLRRFFEYQGYDVTYVMNLTDIDDRIIERALRDNVDVTEITHKFSEAFFEDLQGLLVKPATIYPRATENIDMIISLIEKLVQQGHAYAVEGDVFFDVTTFPEYGKLSGKRLDELKAGARVSVDEKKRNPLDFALWKKQKPGEPAWESPWGPGRPGWHIECSAMSMKHLGETFDIHAGGVDLVFPHHENEIAQSECATHKPFVRYWLHNGFLQIEGDKMSKSLGNFRTVREVLKIYPGTVVRLFFLQKHYRSPIDLTEKGLEAARSASERLKSFYRRLQQRAGQAESHAGQLSSGNAGQLQLFSELREKTVAAMQDDLNTPVALSAYFDMVREANKLLADDSLPPALFARIKAEIDGLDSFLGIIDRSQEMVQQDKFGELVELLIAIRNELRAKKEWSLADRIRDGLRERGVVLEDKPGGTEWHLE